MECGLSAGRPGPILKRDVVRGCGPHTRRILDTAKPKLTARPTATRLQSGNKKYDQISHFTCTIPLSVYKSLHSSFSTLLYNYIV